MSTDLNSEIQAEVGRLDADAKRRVLEFVRALKHQNRGTFGDLIAEFAGTITTEDLETMRDAIEKGCEQVQSLSSVPNAQNKPVIVNSSDVQR